MQALGVARREDLRDRSAGVVPDQVHLSEVQPGAEFLEHRCQAAQSEIVAGPGRALAVQGEIDRDAAAAAGQQADEIAPEVSICPDAVDEQGRRPVSGFGGVPLVRRDVQVANLAGAEEGGLAVLVHLADLHCCSFARSLGQVLPAPGSAGSGVRSG
jgi:ABC-type transporter Mla MlaB component